MDEQIDPPSFPIVVDVPGWQHVKPRIPDTPQRRKLAGQRTIREIVFGAKDGILTTMGVTIGLGAASGNSSTIIITGLLALLSGSLSMGIGEFQGAKSEREVVLAAIEQESQEMREHPAEEFAEQVAYYKLKGFSSEEAHMIVRRLVQNPEIYLYEMMRDEFGVDPREAESSDVRPAIAMALAFAGGSSLPIIPYFFGLSPLHGLIASVCMAFIGLFCVGYYAGTMGSKSPLSRGIEVLLYGSGVFAISFAAGRLIPPLFGHAPISLGG